MVTAIERAAEAPQLLPYLADVQDHLLLVNEEVSAQRDLRHDPGGQHGRDLVEQTNVSVLQNATVEQLTILATIFLPLTFVTGFGQNFGWLVRHQDSFAAFVDPRYRRPGSAAGASGRVAEAPHSHQDARCT